MEYLFILALYCWLYVELVLDRIECMCTSVHDTSQYSQMKDYDVER